MVQIKPEDLNEIRDLEGIDKERQLGMDFVDKIRVKIVDKQLEYTKKHQPFCARCARLDLKDKVEERIITDSRMNKKVDWVAINKIIDDHINNLDVYGDPNRFTKVNESEAFHRFRGDKKETMVGTNIDYKCKFKGCGNTVLVPNDELEPTKGKKIK
jgi:endogenous inhibitor of DNA gyrase (YacG/DUF329 family)